MCLFAIAGVILTVILLVFANGLAGMMHAPKEAFGKTVEYIRICGGGAVFIVAYNVLGAVFRGIGDSKTPLITVIIACVVNIAGDLLFVAVFHMGAAGAALATVAAQVVSVILSYMLIRKKKLPFILKKKDIRINRNMTAKELKIGTPVALQEFLVGTSFLVLQMIVNTFGVVASAGVGVAEKVCVFIMLLPSAFMQSMSAFTAQNMGAGMPERAKSALKSGMITAFLAGIVMGYVSFFHGDFLSSIFAKDSQVIFASHSYLKAYAIDCMLTPFLFCFIGYFNGCEKTLFVMIQGLVGAFCVRIPVAFFVSRLADASLFQIGLATPISSTVQIVMCLSVFYFTQKKAKKLKLE